MRNIFRELEFWVDGVARSGEETMAVDEWLLETRDKPLLRVYGWDGDWGSLGYFGKIGEARVVYPGLRWVRRWTGGGIVDHRGDWTYSLIVPRDFEMARMKGGDSYREIHGVLAEVLCHEMEGVGLSGIGGGGGVCFQSAVEFDVVDGAGVKLAGAGQRRTRLGLLHQGSVALKGDGSKRARLFANRLSDQVVEVDLSVDVGRVNELAEDRYGLCEWLERR